jgi:formylglycine-generating enzyme required for sulfatase activity
MRSILALLLTVCVPAVAAATEEVSSEAVEKARQAVKRADAIVDEREIDMVRTYRLVKADLEVLRGGGGDQLRAKLVELVKAAVDATPSGRDQQRGIEDYLFDSLWPTGLLSPPAARLFARAAAKHVVPFRKEAPEAARAALEDIFPARRPMDEIWDTTFIGIPIVRRWRKAYVELEAAKLELMRCEEGGAAEIPAPPGMVLVAGGRFRFGPHTGYPLDETAGDGVHDNLRGFYIHRHEVTNEAYHLFLEAQPEPQRKALTPSTWEGEPPTFPPGKDRHPVTGVTLAQAMAFAKHHGWRLPSEKEWEKAARGVDGRAWPWGEKFDPTFLVWGGDRASGTAQVLSRPDKDLSPFFVNGMAGNVAELTATFEDGKRFRGKPKSTDRIIIRGGSFETTDPARAKPTFRWVLTATESRPYVGFRCVIPESDWRRKRK